MPRVLREVAILTLAVWALAGCQAKTPPPAPPGPTAAERLEAAKKDLAAGQTEQAVAALTEAVRQDPKLAEAHVLLGLCAFTAKDPVKGEASLRRAIQVAPDAPLGYEALGIALYAAHRRDEAKAALETAVAKGSTNARAYYYLGNLAMFAGECRQAFDAYRRAVALDPSFQAARTEFDAAQMYCTGSAGEPDQAPAR